MSITLGAAALMGGLSLLGSGIGTGINMWENKKNRKFSAAEAQKQRDWETQMSNTSVQRAVADMEKAGINPAMAFGGGAGGGGASTPNGAAAQPGGNGNVFANTINAAANLAATFNMDKDKKNNVTIKEVFDGLGELKKIERINYN